jgi:transposase
MTKQPGARIPRRSLEDTRALAVAALERGEHPDKVAEIFGCGRSTVYSWWAAFRERGPEAFHVGTSPGRPSRLTEEQEARLWGIVVGKDPRQLQFEFALWTRDMIRELIRREFGAEFTPQGVGKLLRRIGMSPQRPLVRAYEQDPERVRRWREEDYPAIHAKAKALGASIFFGDEAGMRTDYHSGTTWSPIGRTPVVKGTGNRETVNMVSAVSPRGEIHFSFVEGRINAETFIDYLRKLLHDVPGKIVLIVDGHSAHTAKATKEFVKSTDGRLTLHLLPPYSPELNPDEWVWKNVKHDRAGKTAPNGKNELRRGIQNAVDRLRRTPAIILGFFRDPDLSYIHRAAIVC